MHFNYLTLTRIFAMSVLVEASANVLELGFRTPCWKGRLPLTGWRGGVGLRPAGGLERWCVAGSGQRKPGRPAIGVPKGAPGRLFRRSSRSPTSRRVGLTASGTDLSWERDLTHWSRITHWTLALASWSGMGWPTSHQVFPPVFQNLVLASWRELRSWVRSAARRPSSRGWESRHPRVSPR